MAARRTQAIRRGRRTGNTNWSRITLPASLVVLPATKILAALFVLDNPGISETIRRTRGLISVSSDQIAAAEDQVGAFGLMKVNDIAAAVGAASIPGPFTDGNDDGWFVHQFFCQRGSAVVASGDLSVQYEIDSKGMRTIEEGFSIAVMIENASAVHALVFNFALAALSSRA